jgi:ribonuclease P protein component
MLPANRRLTTDFFNETIVGRSFHSPLLSIKAIKVSGKSRFAVSASKKIFKTAVSRNRARRRTYSALASLLPHIADGFYVILLVKSETMKLKASEIKSAIENLFQKAGIMKKGGNEVK